MNMNQNFQNDWARLLGSFTNTNLPTEREWKQRLQAWLDIKQLQSEQQQETLHQNLETWRQRTGADSWLAFCRQCDETGTEYIRQCLLWQLQWAAVWREQGYKLQQAMLEARGQGDALLALNAASQEGRQIWDERMESLQLTQSELSPALMESLRRWLASPSDAPPPENTPDGRD